MEHGKTLAGKAADVRAAEQAHRDAVKDALAEARTALAEAGHPLTAGHARRGARHAAGAALARGQRPPRPGRWRRKASRPWPDSPSAPGRPDLRVVPPRTQAAGSAVKPDAVDDDAEAEAEAERAARARRDAERRRARTAARPPRKRSRAARAALQRAEIALDDAERVAKKRRAERDAAAAAHEKAKRALRRLSARETAAP